jgi:predicted SprT family Zn-dependent metalloprotease
MLTDYTPYSALVNKAIAPYLAKIAGKGMIKVTMSNRMKTTGGTCSFHHSSKFAEIKLNSELFSRLSDHDRFEIIAHELGHAVVLILGIRDSSHGYNWASVVRAMGGNPSRTHDHDVEHKLIKRHVFARKSDGRIAMVTSQFIKNKVSLSNLVNVYNHVGVAVFNRNKKTYSWEVLNDKGMEKVTLAGYVRA